MKAPNTAFRDAPGYADECRDYARALNALDAPFSGRPHGEEATPPRERSERAGVASTGFTPNKNNRHGAGEPTASTAMASDRVRVNPQARRCRRMSRTVDNAMRLAETRLAHRGGFRFRRVFVSLTYKTVDGWKPEHVTAYLKTAREWARRKGFGLPYVWVAELQERGALHYHVAFWLPISARIPTADASGWWPHGRTNMRTIKGGASGVTAYMSKYLSKTTPSQSLRYPKGARMHGNGGLTAENKRELRYRLAPTWVRDALGTWADIRKAVGGWCDRLTGEFLASPWRVVVDGAGMVWAFKVN